MPVVWPSSCNLLASQCTRSCARLYGQGTQPVPDSSRATSSCRAAAHSTVAPCSACHLPAPVQVQHQRRLLSQLCQQQHVVVPQHRHAGCRGASLPPERHLQCAGGTAHRVVKQVQAVLWETATRSGLPRTCGASNQQQQVKRPWPPLTVLLGFEMNTAKRCQERGSCSNSSRARRYMFSSQ